MYLMSVDDNFMHDYLYNVHVHWSCDWMIVHLYMQQSTSTFTSIFAHIYCSPPLHSSERQGCISFDNNGFLPINFSTNELISKKRSM